MPNRTRPTDAKVVGADEIAARNRVAGLGEVDTTEPLDGRALEKTNGRSARDIAYGDLIKIVRHAERQVYDGQTALQLQAELDNAQRQMQARQHVDLAVLRAMKRSVDAWVAHAEAGEEA